MYEKIIKDNPDTWNKIVPLSGDIGSPRLGLSEEDAERLFDNVSIVLHLAATVQFNAPLQEAIQYNVSGVQEMIKLCRRMKKLEVRRKLILLFLLFLSSLLRLVFCPRVHSLFFLSEESD